MMKTELLLETTHELAAPVSTLCDIFDQAVASAPRTVALRHLGVALTYHEMGRAVAALARRLSSTVVPGEVIALVLPNSIEFQIAYFAALKALAAPALLDPLYPAAQLGPLLRDAAPRAVLCAPATRDIVTRLAYELGIPKVVCLGRDVVARDLVAEPTKPMSLRTATATDLGALFFSGGTTGIPKAVEHTHGRLVFAVRSMEHIFPKRTDDEVFLPIAPFTHIYGFLTGVLLPLSACGETVLPERFQPELIVELLEPHRVTFFGGGPPAIYAGVLAAGNLGSADLSALRECPAGAAPFPVELMERWRLATGLEIREGYGMSEIAPISGPTAIVRLATWFGRQARARYRCAGRGLGDRAASAATW
jgi:long-chain acyl-CoA synthetase